MNESRAPRRSGDEWQSLVNAQERSSLSCAAFCQSEGIAYQSFMNWRKKLCVAPDEEKVDSPPNFVEIAATPDRGTGSYSSWLVELDIGPGVQLRIAR